jgi:hypothetical protein
MTSVWYLVCRDSSVGIATGYGLDGPGIESQWRNIFRTRSYLPWEPPSVLYNGYCVSFAGVKRSGRGADHPPPTSAWAKERVGLYIYLASESSWPVVGWTLHLVWVPASWCCATFVGDYTCWNKIIFMKLNLTVYSSKYIVPIIGHAEMFM